MKQVLNDLSHWVGGDLSTTSNGDFALANSDQRTQQRIMRRLVTNPGDYIFHPSYGAGLPQFIGQTLDVAAVRGLIRSQVKMEDGVAQSPEPQVDVAAITNGVSVHIVYTSAITSRPVSLTFSVNK